MEKLPFDLLKINADDVDALEATYRALKENFKVGLIKDDAIRLKEFDMFTSHPEATIGGTLLINHPEDGCHLTFVKLRTVIQGGRGSAISYYKYQVWASATLRSDFGRVMIRRESLKRAKFVTPHHSAPKARFCCLPDQECEQTCHNHTQQFHPRR